MTTELTRDPQVATMKALVYQGPGRRAWVSRPKPVLIAPTDAIVRITTTSICGTDLHILKGDVPSVAVGRILGHEGVGIIEEVGSGVTDCKPGDKVLISCISSCGRCRACRKGMYSHCATGGWVLGNTLDGTQAEFVRIPYADTSLYVLPPDADDDAMVMLSDVLPTAYECGVLNGRVQPGDTVAIVGAGPIGLAAMLTAKLYSPGRILMIDTDAHRLQAAKLFGQAELVDATDGQAAKRVMAMTKGVGAQVVIEAVGVPATFELCQAIVAPGGHIANVGVHGQPVSLQLERLWSHNITLTTGLVDTATTPQLLDLVEAKLLDPKPLVTHHFALAEIMSAYDTFGNAARERALKVVLHGEPA